MGSVAPVSISANRPLAASNSRAMKMERPIRAAWGMEKQAAGMGGCGEGRVGGQAAFW